MMNLFDAPPEKYRKYAVLVAVVIILAPLGFSLAAFVVGSETEPFLELPEGEDACLRDTAYMRFHHMDFLKELRDAGVRGGARRDISFLSCIDCHDTRATFCDRCHDSVSLSPDCFGCHYYP